MIEKDIYSDKNIFSQIIEGSVDCNKVYEDNHTLAFYDINPQSPIHIIVVPKGKYLNYEHFCTKAPDFVVSNFFKTVSKIATEHTDGKFRIITNCGKDAGQTIFHFHMHILSGIQMDKLV